MKTVIFSIIKEYWNASIKSDTAFTFNSCFGFKIKTSWKEFESMYNSDYKILNSN